MAFLAKPVSPENDEAIGDGLPYWAIEAVLQENQSLSQFEEGQVIRDPSPFASTTKLERAPPSSISFLQHPTSRVGWRNLQPSHCRQVVQRPDHG